LEYVHNVTDNDNVIGKITREECIEKKFVHRAVAILVFDKKNDIFIHSRSNNKDLFPGYWDGSVGGAVQWGESYEEAALRELNEEIGIVDKISFIFYFTYRSDILNYNCKVYSCITGKQPQINPEEIIEGLWVSIENLNSQINRKSLKFIPDFLKIWKKFNFITD
jgi:isopentenyl-diphosphate delta-isomerase type 1